MSFSFSQKNEIELALVCRKNCWSELGIRKLFHGDNVARLNPVTSLKIFYNCFSFQVLQNSLCFKNPPI